MRELLTLLFVLPALLIVGVVAAQNQASPTPGSGTPTVLCATPVAQASATPLLTSTAGPAAATPGGSAPGTPIGLYPCGTPGAGAAQTSVTIDLVDIAFKPMEFTIPANTDVSVTLTNTGSIEHNFSITNHNNPNVKNLGIDVDPPSVDRAPSRSTPPLATTTSTAMRTPMRRPACTAPCTSSTNNGDVRKDGSGPKS